MRNDAMRMVPEYILPGWRKHFGAVEAGRKVGREEGPNWERANEIGSMGKSTRMPGVGEENVDEVRKKDRPEKGNRTEEEEEA